MEILIRTKKSFWDISFRNGIRRVDSIDWNNAKVTFETLIAYQSNEVRKALEAPVLQSINEQVAIGAANAPKNAANWQAVHRSRWHKEAEGADTTLLPDDVDT